MPYYAWSGVDITGTIRTGKLFAKSETQLDEQLLKQGIALLKSKPAWWHLYRSVSLADKLQFFRQLAVLIRAGVLVPDALVLLADQLAHPVLQEAVHTVADWVSEGIALHDAFNRYPALFSSLMIQQVRTGHESGNLADALEALSDMLEDTNTFYMQLRAALMLPMLTLLFFIGVTGVLFTVMVPRFAQLFATFKHELPYATKLLLRMHQLLTSWRLFVVAALLVSICLLISWWRKTEIGKNVLDSLVLRMPFVGRIVVGRFATSFLQSISLLLGSGMSLVPALDVVATGVGNSVLRERVLMVKSEVEQGRSLSIAMMMHASDLFGASVRAMVTVGEQSGQLPALLATVAKTEQQMVMRNLRAVTLLLQPLLMLLLGLLVTLLIVAVYGPIINLSHAVSL